MITSSVAVALLATPKQCEGGWATPSHDLKNRFTRASHPPSHSFGAASSEAATEE